MNRCLRVFTVKTFLLLAIWPFLSHGGVESPKRPATEHHSPVSFTLSTPPLDLSRAPTSMELMAPGQLSRSLYPTHVLKDKPRAPMQNWSSGQAIQVSNQHQYALAVNMFRKHLEDFPDSPCAVGAALHIGCDASHNCLNTVEETPHSQLINSHRGKPILDARMLLDKARQRSAMLNSDLKQQSPDCLLRDYASHLFQRLARYAAAERALDLPSAALQPWTGSATKEMVAISFRRFLKEAVVSMPFKPYQRLPVLTLSEAKQKALEVINIFKAFEVKIKYLNSKIIAQEFESFYYELLAVLPPNDFKVEMIEKGRFDEEDAKKLYIHIRNYLASCRVLVIYSGFNEVDWTDVAKTTTCVLYTLSDDIFFIDEIGHLGVPVVRPLLAHKSSFPPEERGNTSNGIPFIAGESIEYFVEYVQRFSQQPKMQILGELSFPEVFARGISRGNGIALAKAFVNFEGRSLAIAFSMAKLAAMHKLEAELLAAAKLGTAWHEKQHSVDFMNPAEEIAFGKLNPFEKEKRAELRARVAALRHAPWDSLFGLLGEPEVKGDLLPYQEAKKQIFNAQIKIIQENPTLFSKVIIPLDAKDSAILALKDNGEINIIAQLYKFAIPEYESEVNELTDIMARRFGLYDLL